MTCDVLFVQAPYGAVERPSIGLALLHAALAETEIRSEVSYVNFDFAERIGPDLYYAISVSPNEELMGEWTFAKAAFPDYRPDADAYYSLVEQSFEHGGFNLYRLHRPVPDMREVLEWVREQAVTYVDETARSILKNRPRIVGASSTFQQHTAALALLRRVKELDPTVITMLGGANCESNMGIATRRNFAWVDVVVSGEAEGMIYPLCRRLLDHGATEDGPPMPNGVLGSAPTAAGQRALISDLDQSPIPDFGSYYESVRKSSLARYIMPGLLIETSRGCWWGQTHHCTFCGLNGHGMAYRTKSPERVVDELATQSERYGIQRFEAVDNILSLDYFDSVLPAIRDSPKSYDIFFEIKSNLKREQLETLADAGVRWVQPGIESLHDGVLRAIDKGCTATQNIQYLKWARELGIRTFWIWLFDVPGDQDAWYAEMAELVPMIEHLQPPDGFTRTQFHRFSPYHQRPDDFGLTLSPGRAYEQVYPLPRSELSELAYFFDDYERVDRCEQFPANEESLPPGLQAIRAAIKKWRRRWWGPPKVSSWPLLLATEEGEGLLFEDRRECAVEPRFELTGLDADVYRACETTRGREGLLRALRQEHGPELEWARVEESLTMLEARKIVLESNRRFLSLALKSPLRPFATMVPSGHVDVLAYRRDHRQRAG